MTVGIRHADHMAPLYPQKLALTSLTSGGRSVSIVCSRTQATEFSASWRPSHILNQVPFKYMPVVL
jgi:hypothetical protein